MLMGRGARYLAIEIPSIGLRARPFENGAFAILCEAVFTNLTRDHLDYQMSHHGSLCRGQETMLFAVTAVANRCDQCR